MRARPRGGSWGYAHTQVDKIVSENGAKTSPMPLMFNAGPARTAAALALVPQILSLGPRINCTGMIDDPYDAVGAVRAPHAYMYTA